jgi:hypothetical protein
MGLSEWFVLFLVFLTLVILVPGGMWIATVARRRKREDEPDGR